MIMRIYVIVAILIHTSITFGFCQSAKILYKKRQLNIKINSSKPLITQSDKIQKQYFNSFYKHSTDYIFYSELEKLVSFEAYSEYENHKGKTKKVLVSSYTTRDIVEPGIFYGGNKIKEFVYPSLIENARTTLSTQKIIKDPHIISAFYFDNRLPSDKSILVLKVSQNIKIDYTLFNCDKLKINFSIDTLSNGDLKYEWVAQNIEKRVYEENSPSSAFYSPHINIRVKSYMKGSKEVGVCGSVENLYSWYNSLLDKIPKNMTSNSLDSLVNKLIEGDKSEIQKTITLFKWVQSNIKYIAFENGMSGFIPRNAYSVYHRKYGDCKDMANLLTTMLKMAKLKAYVAWVGTRKKPYSYYTNPSTVSDNHMITVVEIDNEYYIIDPTFSYQDFGEVPYYLEGKEVLVAIDEDKFKVIKARISSNEENQRIDSLLLNLNNEELYVSGKTTLKGNYSIKAMMLENRAKRNNKEKWIEQYLNIGKTESNYENLDFEVKDKNYQLKYDIKLLDLYNKVGNKIYLELDIFNLYESIKIDFLNERKTQIENEYKNKRTIVYEIKLPKGYLIEYLPNSQSMKNEFFEVNTTFKLINNSVFVNVELIEDYLLLEASSSDAYIEYQKQIRKITNEQIVFRKN